jgi:hypothetical protein
VLTGEGHIDLTKIRTRSLTAPPAGSIKAAQHTEDRQLAWQPRMSSADIAYILYQAPVLIAVHAREMLRG